MKGNPVGWFEIYVQDMDREGVDIGVLFPTTGLGFCWYEDQEAELSAALCRAYNSWLSDYCSIAPDHPTNFELRKRQATRHSVSQLIGPKLAP